MTKSKTTAERIAEFNRSFQFDRRLFAADVRVGIAFCDQLFHAGILTRAESERIKNGLQTILKRADFYADYFEEPQAADVHHFVEMRLAQLIGDAGAKLNVGSSRHDRLATALRLWLREEIEEISRRTRDLQTALINHGEQHREAILPAYADSKRAQPILWAHWCLAYFEMFARDRERLEEAWRRVNILPLGAGVTAGTSIEIDREELARQLDFEGVSANSLDTAADRDFAVETVGACALLMIHLSRLAEDLILYDSAEFDFINLQTANSNQAFRTNRAAAALELVRGKTARVLGHQTALGAAAMNLPLGVHRDFQETAALVFDAVDAVKSSLEIVALILQNARVNEEKTRAAVSGIYLNADELIDYLLQRNVSTAHARDAVNRLVAYAAERKKNLEDLSLPEFRRFSEIVGEDVFEYLSLEHQLTGKNQIGGTAPERVSEALEHAREDLEREAN